jgi:hypothetical protein
MVDAENAVALKFVLRDVLIHAINKAPDLARELMEPAKAIKEIRVLQTNNGGSGNGNGALGSATPIIKTVLEAGAAYPLFKQLVEFAQNDPGKLGEKAKGMLGDLGEELGQLLGKKQESAGDVRGDAKSENEAEPITQRPIVVAQRPIPIGGPGAGADAPAGGE